VAKKKDSMALFEVISKSREKRAKGDMGVPDWMGDSEKDASQAPEASTTSTPPSLPKAARKPAVVKTGGQLQVTLNYISCLAIALGLVVLLGGMFWLGRSTAPTGGGDPEQAGMQNDGYRPGLLGQSGSKGGSKTGAKQTPMRLPPRQSGKYYLVIESTGGKQDWHKEQAAKIQRFCYEAGEPSSIATYPATRNTKEQVVIWSLTPFDSPRSTEATQHAKMVEMLGGRYFAKHGHFKFQQRKNKDAPLDPWYLKAK